MYSIFATVSGTYAATFTTMDQAIAFVKQLLEAFLVGFAVAAVVNLLVFPRSVRDTLWQQTSGYFVTLKKLIASQQTYLYTMTKAFQIENSDTRTAKRRAATKELKGSMRALSVIHGKVHGDLTFAKREIAFGSLDGKQMEKIVLQLRMVSPTAISGMLASPDQLRFSYRSWVYQPPSTSSSGLLI